MASKTVLAQGPSKLTKIIAHLDAAPKLVLPNVKALRLSLAFRNDHFGARHFMREQLPRIRWANPDLDIQVERVKKTINDKWRPELELEFTSGTTRIFNLQDKWSSTILKDLMDAGGGEPWRKWTAAALLAGKPVVPESVPTLVPDGGVDEEHVAKVRSMSGGQEKLPSLKEFRAAAERVKA